MPIQLVRSTFSTALMAALRLTTSANVAISAELPGGGWNFPSLWGLLWDTISSCGLGMGIAMYIQHQLECEPSTMATPAPTSWPGTAPHFEPLWKLKWNYHKGAVSAIPFGAIGTMIVELEMNDVWKDLPYQSSFIWVCLRLGYPNPPYCLKHDLPQQWTQGSVYCRSMGCPFWKKPQGPDGLRTLMFQGRKSWFPPHLHLIANP